MDIKINNYVESGIINSFSGELDIPIDIDCLEETLVLPKNIGQGKIKGYSFSHGIYLLILDYTLQEDWKLVIRDKKSTVQFNFCIKGKFQHQFNKEDMQYVLNALRGTITAGVPEYEQVFKFQKNVPILSAIIIIDKQAYFPKIECILDDMPDKLSEVFKDLDGTETYFYHSNYSISIAENIKEILENENKGLVRSTHIEGKTLEILSMQIKQYIDDEKSMGKQLMIRKDDVENIKKARDLLLNSYNSPPTIEQLARQSGINQQKLKKGFKMVFNKTINQYVRDKRLEIAAARLLNGSSVKDAATYVGYTNQSHFATKFKDKYGVLPKDYLKSILVRVKTVC